MIGIPLSSRLMPLLKRHSVLFFVLVLAAAALLLPCAAESETKTLISDEYVILRDGETQKFQLGYEAVLKGFGADSVLVEFYNNHSKPVSVGSVILKEGETVQCYRKADEDNLIVLMMTLDKMYFNNSQVIVGFSHVYQFEDVFPSDGTEWVLETAVLEDPSTPGSTKPPEGGSNIGQDLMNPLYIIILIGAAAVAVCIIRIFSEKKPKKSKKNSKDSLENEK
ncbi:hypothetical protein MmiAt1_09340 [Methanimicrococcus sp. At1]|uniref:S-layer family duplication domain-containing protein n=1 Tax=Methanimicrococcus hacksteinii TaxID=3028293 RepID=A0ABU3VPX7_9EURY|nr:hypothetical protein [Methanimicrococcus sp. At1]MDV0445359.1 hypothetical protein [Methanimicrococcus sp. At1]